MDGEDFFSQGNKLLSQLHLTGVVKFPSLDQKFLAESNATAKIKAQMIDFSNRLVLFDRDKNLSTLDDLSIHYPVLADFLVSLATNEEGSEKESFESKSLLQLKDIIENADENQSFAAQELRNDFASDLGEFLIKGLRLRSIDRTATTAAQERAISDMEPTVISVQEGDIILMPWRKSHRIRSRKISGVLRSGFGR